MLERLLATIDLLAVDLEGREERFNLAVSDSVPARPVTAVIVTYQSAHTIGRTLAAARRGYDDHLLDTIQIQSAQRLSPSRRRSWTCRPGLSRRRGRSRLRRRRVDPGRGDRAPCGTLLHP